MISEARHLDGNAAAGLLAEVFGVELTAARATCAHCGAAEALGAAHVYTGGPGTVLRCAHCSGVLMRIARAERFAVDATGIAALAP